MHVARFGAKFDAQGFLAGSKDPARCIGYLIKYPTKQLGDCHHPAPTPSATTWSGSLRRCGSSRASPTCANWLRYEPGGLVSYRLGQPLFTARLDSLGPREAAEFASRAADVIRPIMRPCRPIVIIRAATTPAGPAAPP